MIYSIGFDGIDNEGGRFYEIAGGGFPSGDLRYMAGTQSGSFSLEKFEGKVPSLNLGSHLLKFAYLQDRRASE